MFIFQIDPGKILGAENKKDVSKPIENPDSVLLSSMSQTSKLNLVEGVQSINQRQSDNLLETIQELSTNLLEYHNPQFIGTSISKLAKALAEYTHTENEPWNEANLHRFFLRNKSDLTGDGQIDYQDVVACWKHYDKSQEEFPWKVYINLESRKYIILGGMIWEDGPHMQPVHEIDSIPGVDLHKLSEEIKKKFEECQQQNGGQCNKIEFNADLNNNGKIDYIEAEIPTISTPQK